MKVQIVILITIAITAAASGKKSAPVGGAPSGPSSNGYSQPIASPYAPVSNPGRSDPYPYGSQQMVMAGSSPTADYYQPMDSAGYGTYPAASPTYPTRGAGGPYYEPVPQGSGHHHHQHPAMKRGHGWHPHNELSTILYIALPLIILPLLLLWPYFLLTPHHHHPVVYAAGWKRSADGKAPVVSSAEEVKNKTDELAEKILPKLEKAGKDA